MKTRAAILWELYKPLVIEDIEVPVLKKGQVLVKILYSGVCRAQYNEMIGLKGPDKFLPHTLGHEGSGVVMDIGKGITKVKKGDCVCLSWIKGRGLDGMNTQYKLGSRVINAGAVTTFSDYAVVSENRLTKIPKAMPADIASIIGCAVVTGCGIIQNTLSARKGDSIAVFGVGGVGLSVVLGAKRAGCGPIIAVDIADPKLRFAKTLGATHGIHAARSSVLKEVLTIVPGGVDFAVDASGSKTAMETAFACVKDNGGTCVVAGNLSKDEKIELHPFDLIKGKKIRGTWGGETDPDADIPRYARAFLQGQMPVDQLITHRFGLQDINKAFEVLVKGGAGRIVLEMDQDI
jgi:S-(hydroxymethyl)glutathione dehydrogenase/alcohol dehydrogenase